MGNGENKNKFIKIENNFQEESSTDLLTGNKVEEDEEENHDYNGLNLFYADVQKYPSLRREEEIECVKNLKFEFDNGKKKVIHNDAYETLIKHNLKTVWDIVRKQLFNNTKHEFFEELISAGYEVLCQDKAFTNFDPNKGNRFSTYVATIIDNAVRRTHTALQIKRPAIQGGLDIINTYRYFFVNLEEELNRYPTFEELNKKLIDMNKKKISLERYKYLFQYTEKGVEDSLDEYVKIGNRCVSRYEIVADSRAQQDFIDLEQRIDFEKLLEVIRESNLTVLEKNLLIEHCLEDKTYRELGEKYSKSYETIRTTINKVKEKINKTLASKNLTIEDFL